jgi:L-2-hydroxyglutarate oxidase LhgO
MDQVECVVVGAGAVGLAVARRLALAGRETLILEAADVIGSGVSSRNSEVIHAGLYYPAGSVKARACVAGRRMLYEYCAARGIGHRRVGKLIVAADEGQAAKLAAIRAAAAAAGCDDLKTLTAGEATALEPSLRCVGALLSPSTGIIDSHGLMLALLGDAEAAGATLALRSPAVAGRPTDDGFVLEVGGAEPMRLACRLLINAAGLGAIRSAAALAGLPASALPRPYLAKGNYFTLSGARAPFSRLIYPVPEDGGLGVHLTLDLGGQARFGPDVEWLAADDPAVAAPELIDYRVDPARGDGFYAAIRRYWPDLPDGALVPAYSGVRPKISGPGGPAADFLIQGPAEHKIPGLVNLLGIESPGLTSCMALADLTAAALGVD